MTSPIPLPPTEIRQGSGPLRHDDDYLVETALSDVELMKTFGLADGMSVIDFGSGPGRIAIGLLTAGWTGRYLGVEVNQRHVDWATKELTARFPDFVFERVDAENDRYNPKGTANRQIPVDDGSVDLLCAYSVFSHMGSAESVEYFREFGRVLAPNGQAFITAFVDDDVPDETVNPEWMGTWNGALHCVLYEREYFRRLVESAGLRIVDFIQRDVRKQTGVLLARPD